MTTTTELAWQNIETAEVEFLNNLAEKGGLADPLPGMLRHCARLIVSSDIRDRFKLAARTLVRGERGADGKITRPLYAEDVETLHDVLRILEGLTTPEPDAAGESAASNVKVTKLAFERRYSDDSGVEFGVSYDASESDAITFKRIGEVGFPADELDWLIECLTKIRAELAKVQP